MNTNRSILALITLLCGVGTRADAAECAANGGEWRCTTVSTGSSPGPENDVRSCVCIRNK